MIFDNIKVLDRYDIPLRTEIAAFLGSTDLPLLTAPELEIKGRQLFVRFSRYLTKKPNDGKFETHRRYIDLQYILQGSEIMETAPADSLLALTEYDAKGDFAFFSAERNISRILVRAGEFMLFFPGEAHRPCCSPETGENEVRKLVFKIAA